MKKQRFIFLYRIGIAIGIACNFSVYGQISTSTSGNQISDDSLSLVKIISAVVQNHPSVKEGIEAINYADAGIGLAKSGYYPDVNAGASYTRLGPAEKLTFPGLGTFMLYPVDNYTASLNYEQTLYDFGKTSRNISYANELKNLSQQTIEQVKQKLAITVTTLFYTMVYLQESIVINKTQQKTLQNHLDFIQKKKETGSATQYEILSTKVKISTAESQGIDLETSLKNQIAELNSLMGQDGKTQFVVKKELDVKLPDHSADSLTSFALAHRDEILIAQEKKSAAELKYKIVKAQNNPVFNVFASGGGKNGYFPDLNAVKADFVAGIELEIPLFDGTRSKYHLVQANSAIQTAGFETEIVKRIITSEVTECEENLNASLKKIEHYKLQLSQAEEAYTLAQTSYQAGSINNLDVLDAATNVSESKLALLKSKIEYLVNIYKLKAAIGERLY